MIWVCMPDPPPSWPSWPERPHGGVWIMKNGDTADATSMLDILTLACPKGSEITVSIDDEADMNYPGAHLCTIRSGFGE
jgi:phosphocarrier protein HPr